jgi:hypothetical protein
MQHRKYDWSGWTKWHNLLKLDFSGVKAGPGAYVISAGQRIGRSVGIDPDGFLDIGESGALRNRIGRFLACSGTSGQTGHMAGWRYYFFGFDRHFVPSSLRVRWIVTDTKAQAYAIEGQTLLTYLRNHFELPPLNYKFNWSSFGDQQYACIGDYDRQAQTAARRAKRAIHE